MTLQEAVDVLVMDKPEGKIGIIRGPKHGWRDNYFTYDINRKKLIANSWVCRSSGMKLSSGVAAFQESKHTDWILI